MLDIVSLLWPEKVGELASVGGPDFDDPVIWSVAAQSAFPKEPQQLEPHLQKAFEALELNPRDPRQWRELASRLAAKAFPKINSGGRPIKWDADRYCELLRAVDRSKSKSPGRSDRAVCSDIAKKSQNEFFRKSGGEGLRKALRKARSPLHNQAVKQLLETFKPTLRRKVEEGGGTWSDNDYEKVLAERLADWLGRQWRRSGDENI